MRSLTLLIFVCVAHVAAAQQPAVQFVQPAATLEEALNRRDKAEAAAKAELDKAEAAYLAETTKADQQLIADLKQLAKKAAANGDIADAAKAWEAVLKIDVQNKEASEFFIAIRRMNVIESARSKVYTRQSASRPTVMFVTESGRVFRRLRNGLWSDIYADGKQLDPLKELSREGDRITLHRITDPEDSRVQLDGNRLLWKKEGDGYYWRELEAGYWK